MFGSPVNLGSPFIEGEEGRGLGLKCAHSSSGIIPERLVPPTAMCPRSKAHMFQSGRRVRNHVAANEHRYG